MFGVNSIVHRNPDNATKILGSNNGFDNRGDLPDPIEIHVGVAWELDQIGHEERNRNYEKAETPSGAIFAMVILHLLSCLP